MVVTTNYDDLVEQAFADEGLEFDVVWYEAKQNAEARGRFVHRAPGGKPMSIARANKYTGLPIKLERPAVLKLHGCLDRESADDDSYVITEDSYIDYLSGGDVGALIPIALSQRMTSNSLLFLGYSLSDWNLRVVINRIWGARKLVVKSWAVQREPADPNQSKIEQALWDARENVELVYCELSQYVQELEAKLPGTCRRSRADESRNRRGGCPGRIASAEPLRRARALRRGRRGVLLRTLDGGRHCRRKPPLCAADDPVRSERRRQELAADGGRRPRPARGSTDSGCREPVRGLRVPVVA